MKKTVFLLLIFTFLSFNTTINASSEEIFGFSDYQMRCTPYSTDLGRGYHINKLGTNPFEVDVFYEEYQLYINDVTEINGKHVFYGYTHYFEGENYYDYFVLVLDTAGNEELVILEDLYALEEVVHVAEFDNVMLIHVEQSERAGTYTFNENYFILYDFEHNYLGREVSQQEIKRVLVTDHMFIFDYDYTGDYSGALTSDLEFVYDDILDIETNQVFNEQTTILFLNEALLNDQVVSNGTTITYPGYYNLFYNDFNYTFTVEPKVTGVIDNEVYTEAITPYFEFGNAYLNEDLYISGTPITEPGNYVLTILGVNGYEKDINFTINATVEGVLNNQVYDEEVVITFEGDGYLNNTYVESPYTVNEEGDYILKVRGEGNYLETYNFQVEKEEEKSDIIDIIQKFDIVFLGVVVIGGGLILKKK